MERFTGLVCVKRTILPIPPIGKCWAFGWNWTMSSVANYLVVNYEILPVSLGVWNFLEKKVLFDKNEKSELEYISVWFFLILLELEMKMLYSLQLQKWSFLWRWQTWIKRPNFCWDQVKLDLQFKNSDLELTLHDFSTGLSSKKVINCSPERSQQIAMLE